jgi:hypothetical protein
MTMTLPELKCVYGELLYGWRFYRESRCESELRLHTADAVVRNAQGGSEQ